MTYDPDMIDKTFDMITDSDLTDTSKAPGQAALPSSCPIALPSSSSNSKPNANESNFGAKLSCQSHRQESQCTVAHQWI